MYPNKQLLILLISIGLLFSGLSLQAQRFKGGVVAGLSASQVDGDNSNGYNKLGLVGGGNVMINFNRRFDMSLGILFAQRGSQSELIKGNVSFNYFSQTFNYIDLPVQLHIRDWFVEDDDGEYAKISLNLGLSYGRFMSAKYKDDLSALTVVEPYLRKNDLNYIIGASIYANRHFSFTLQAVRGLGYIYNPNDWDTPPVQSAWYSHSLYFLTRYDF